MTSEIIAYVKAPLLCIRRFSFPELITCKKLTDGLIRYVSETNYPPPFMQTDTDKAKIIRLLNDLREGNYLDPTPTFECLDVLIYASEFDFRNDWLVTQGVAECCINDGFNAFYLSDSQNRKVLDYYGCSLEYEYADRIPVYATIGNLECLYTCETTYSLSELYAIMEHDDEELSFSAYSPFM
jgi:hypothetical protein